MAEFWKIFSIIIASALGFEKIAVPSAVAMFGFDFWKLMGIVVFGNLLGLILFANISAAFLKWWDRAKVKYFNAHKHPKVFTKTNRTIIKIKKRFGLWGIAFFTPIGLSIPVGTFVGERFYKDKKKVIMALGISLLVWNLVIYFLLSFFYESAKTFF